MLQRTASDYRDVAFGDTRGDCLQATADPLGFRIGGTATIVYES